MPWPCYSGLFIGAGSLPEGGRREGGRGVEEGGCSSKRLFRAPLPGRERGLIRLRLWSDWAYSLRQRGDAV